MTKTQKAKAAALKINSAKCRQSAFNTGVSRSALLADIFNALGATPDLESYNLVQHDSQVGYMAAYLRRKGDNRPDDELLTFTDTLLTKYQGNSGVTPVKTGMLGRRTKEQEDAYGSARHLWGRDVTEAGVTKPVKSGTGSGVVGNQSAAKPTTAKATTAKAAANDADKPASPKLSSEAQAVKYAERQAAAMLATINKSGKAVPAWLKSAVADFKSAVDAKAANSHPFVASK